MKDVKTKILIAEDDTNLGIILSDYLTAKGYDITLTKDGAHALLAFKNNSFDLCLFDVMMPQKDGFTLAKEIRAKDEKIPILFLTAKSMKEDTIEGFKIGGDDYITKPFSMEELLMRIAAVLKRTKVVVPKHKKQEKYTLGKLILDVKSLELISQSGEKQKLTSKESEILELLFQHKDDVLDRNYALKQVWGDDSYFNARSMDVFISRIRKYLKMDSGIEILNIHGKGFKLIVK